VLGKIPTITIKPNVNISPACFQSTGQLHEDRDSGKTVVMEMKLAIILW